MRIFIYCFFIVASAFGQGTAITPNTWTKLPSAGWPIGPSGYDSFRYSPELDCHLLYGLYHENQGEPNQAIGCYSFAKQRWDIWQNFGTWQDSYQPVSGHPVGLVAWMSQYHAFWTIGENAGSNMPQRTNHTYWIDGAGLALRDNYTGIAGNILPLNGGNVVASAQYDTVQQKVFLYPNATANGGTHDVSIYDPSTNLYTKPTTSGSAPASSAGLLFPASAWDSTRNLVYLFGGNSAGANCDGTKTGAVYSFDLSTNTWATITTHDDPITGHSPSARLWNGFAYSAVDDIILMVSGCTSTAGGTLTDTWALHPSTGNWEEITALSNYVPLSGAGQTPFERLSYDSVSNAFVMGLYGDPASNDNTGGTGAAYSMAMWAYCYSTCLNSGRTGGTYAPTAGYINTRFTGTSTESNGQVDEGSILNTSLAVNGSTIYAAWIESGKPFATGELRVRHPYAYSSTDGITLTGLGSDWSALDVTGTESDNSHLTIASGTPWIVWSNGVTTPINPQLKAASWNGSSWSTPISIASVGGSGYYRGISAITPIGAVANVASIEHRSSYFTGSVYINQCSGTTCPQLGGSLTVNSGGRPLFVDITSDGTNPYVCHTEEIVNTGTPGYTVSLTPQLYCHYYTGSAWVQIAASLNQSAAAWAADVSTTYFGSHLYVAYTERVTAGNPKIYVYSCTTSACTLVGNDLRNNTSTGWPWNPRLTNDGTTLYMTWEEQSSINQKVMLRGQSYNGSSWTTLGGAINADTTNGSAAYSSLAVVSGNPVVLWAEESPGNLRQAYIKHWNGAAWVGFGSGSTGGSTSGGKLAIGGGVRR